MIFEIYRVTKKRELATDKQSVYKFSFCVIYEKIKKTITVYNTPRNHEASKKHPQAPQHEADKPP